MDFSSLIELVYEENPNIAENVIVPTSTGYFIVNIESTGTELPFEYEFSLDGSLYSDPLTDEEIETLKAQTDDFIELASSATTISGTVTPPDDLSDTVIHSFLIYFGWYDGENEELDNKEDVSATKTAHSSTPAGKGVIDLNLNIAQIDGSTP